MYRPYFPRMVKNSQGDFNLNYNPNYRFPSIPAPQYTQRYPFNRNRAPQQNYNEEHWCETCDRSFYTLELLEKHKQQHQKCNIDGCQFIAHPKVITKHIQMQHASGLYKKIAKLNNPEEIQKWREERKKRYPTKVNIEQKAAEIKEKIDRGEKMGLNKDRHHRQFNKGNPPHKRLNTNAINQQNRRRPHQKLNNTSTINIKKPRLPKKVNNMFPSAENLRKLKPFAGIQKIVMEDNSTDLIQDTNCNFIIEDDDCGELSKPVQENVVHDTEPRVCGALSLLMCDYDFSDDEDINVLKVNETMSKPDKSKEIRVNPQISNSTTAIKVIESKMTNNKIENQSDEEGPEEMKIDKCTEAQVVEQTPQIDGSDKIKKKVLIEKRPNRGQPTKPRRNIPSTLLQKLLRREVQQERNIILQCIRHIVKNSFFDKN